MQSSYSCDCESYMHENIHYIYTHQVVLQNINRLPAVVKFQMADTPLSPSSLLAKRRTWYVLPFSKSVMVVFLGNGISCIGMYFLLTSIHSVVSKFIWTVTVWSNPPWKPSAQDTTAESWLMLLMPVILGVPGGSVIQKLEVSLVGYHL